MLILLLSPPQFGADQPPPAPKPDCANFRTGHFENRCKTFSSTFTRYQTYEEHQLPGGYFVREEIEWVAACEYELTLADSDFPALSAENQIGRTLRVRMENVTLTQYQEFNVKESGAEWDGCVEVKISPL